MSLITLTTDFGTKDHFVGAVKGAILSQLSDAKIVDISHEISPFNIAEAAYILKNSYKSFPVGTIHIIGVDSELNPENKHLVVKFEGQYFICADNGIMSMACLNIEPEKIVEINIHDKLISNFSVLDVFVKVACHISRGGKLEVIGKSIDKIKSVKNLTPFINESKNQIIGNVIYIDNPPTYEFSLYPNPNQGILSIEIAYETSDAQLQLYDLKGKLWDAMDIKNSSRRIDWDISRFPAGTYVIRLISDGISQEKTIRKSL